jgi:hypothetical protein
MGLLFPALALEISENQTLGVQLVRAISPDHASDF